MLGTGVGQSRRLNLWSSGTHWLIQGPGTEVHLLVREGSGRGDSMGKGLKVQHRARPVTGILRCLECPERPKASEVGVV